ACQQGVSPRVPGASDGWDNFSARTKQEKRTRRIGVVAAIVTTASQWAVTFTTGSRFAPAAPRGRETGYPDGNPSPDQDNAHVHDVGLGQPRLEQVAGRLEERVGVVAGQEGGRVEPLFLGAAEGPLVGDRPGAVGGSVLAVGAAAEHHQVAEPLAPQLNCRR